MFIQPERFGSNPRRLFTTETCLSLQRLRTAASTGAVMSDATFKFEKIPQWKLIAVNEGFDKLMDALDRAARKGYMPDAIADEWDEFDWRDDPNVAARSQQAASGSHQEARSDEQGCAACATCGKPWVEST